MFSTNHNRRAGRARRAKDTLAKGIPDILRASPRARHGIHKAELIVDPHPPTHHGSSPLSAIPCGGPKIRLSASDTLTAAGKLSERPFASKRTAPTLRTTHDRPNVAVLNMASPYRPGGGFLDGANSQEEFLCHRTTLYPSLWDSFYRLPELGGIYTPDVMVFRDATPDAIDLQKRDRYFIDVITAGAFKFPDVRRGRSDDRLDGACSCGMSYCDRDRELVTRKMKSVLRIAQSKGVEKLVLGAWGCGAFGNPVKDVAKLWRKVIAGSPRQRRPNVEQWEGIKEIVFAVPDPIMLKEFRRAFGDIVTAEVPSPGPQDIDPDPDVGVGVDADAGTAEAGNREREYADLILKVQETEMQIEQVTNPRTKTRLRDALALLNRQLAQNRAARASKDEDLSSSDEEEQVDGFVVAHAPGSDDDVDGHFSFLEETASDSEGVPLSPAYEFRPPPPGLDPPTSHDEDDDVPGFLDDAFYTVHKPSPRFDPQTGWFAGSIDEFHGLLKGGHRAMAAAAATASRGSRPASHSSPVLRPNSSGGQLAIEEFLLNEYLGKYGGSDEHPE